MVKVGIEPKHLKCYEMADYLQKELKAIEMNIENGKIYFMKAQVIGHLHEYRFKCGSYYKIVYAFCPTKALVNCWRYYLRHLIEPSESKENDNR